MKLSKWSFSKNRWVKFLKNQIKKPHWPQNSYRIGWLNLKKDYLQISKKYTEFPSTWINIFMRAKFYSRHSIYSIFLLHFYTFSASNGHSFSIFSSKSILHFTDCYISSFYTYILLHPIKNNNVGIRFPIIICIQ